MIKVGIIGASAERGWAKDAHVPAIQKLAGLELVAVATSRQLTADAAAHAFGAHRAYGDPAELLRDPEVALVTIAVPVPAHRDLVLAAVAAGKHVYCEWPLGKDTPETEELAGAVRGVHAAIGLQAQASAVVKRARELVNDGAIGRVLTARIRSTTVAFGPDVEAAMAFGEEAASGVTLVTIQGAHTIDVAAAVLGQLDAPCTQLTTQYPSIRIDGNPATRTVPDQLLAFARIHDGGGALAVEVTGGCPPGDVTFHFAITGTNGTLVLEGGALRGFQSGRLTLSLDKEHLHVDEGEIAVMPDSAANVAAMYALLRDDILRGTSSATDFQHAAWLRSTLDAWTD